MFVDPSLSPSLHSHPTQVNIEFRSEAQAGELIESLGSSATVPPEEGGEGGAAAGNGNGHGSGGGAAAQLWSHTLRRPPSWDGRSEEEIVRATSLWVPRPIPR